MLNPELSLECRNRRAPAVNAKPEAGDAYSRGFFEVGMVPAYTVVEISSHQWGLVGPTPEPRAQWRPPGGPWGSRSSPGSRATPPVPAPLHRFQSSPGFRPSTFNVRGLTALAGRPVGRLPQKYPPPQAISEIDYTTPEDLVKSTGTFEGAAFLKIITPCGAAGSNLQKLPGHPF